MRQRWRDDAKLYYFEFTLGGGSVFFGFFGTERQWEGKMEDYYQEGEEVKLLRKEYRCTGKEQKEHSVQMAAAFAAMHEGNKQPT